MNEVELKENPQADDFCVQNLNEDPRLRQSLRSGPEQRAGGCGSSRAVLEVRV